MLAAQRSARYRIVVHAAHAAALIATRRTAPRIHLLVTQLVGVLLLRIRVAGRDRNMRADRRFLLADHAIAIALLQDRVDRFLRVEERDLVLLVHAGDGVAGREQRVHLVELALDRLALV